MPPLLDVRDVLIPEPSHKIFGQSVTISELLVTIGLCVGVGDWIN